MQRRPDKKGGNVQVRVLPPPLSRENGYSSGSHEPASGGSTPPPAIDDAAWNVYMTLLKSGQEGLARGTLRNLMAREIAHAFPWLGWGPWFRIGLRR